MTSEAKIIPFGKYKGRFVEEVLIDDPAYLQWLAGQDWFRAKFTVLHQVIINRGAEPEETPDHNAMQVRFLDDEFCQRFLRCLIPNLIKRIEVEVAFEISGIDVVLWDPTNHSGYVSTIEIGPCHFCAGIPIEIKPVVGDNYPAVLRQMRANHSTVLFVGEYTGKGASREQFVKTMATAGIRVVFAADLNPS